ncbi:hypothetical protein ACJMK2_038899 [Sinanodonta woodiana]|uniref:Uncharacterized protein n=1 Tax=Sinanodonta woodiana TaxID=1069815 RepID=A0ABD3WAH0_SINWO
MEKKSFCEGGGETSITAPLLAEHVAQRDPPPSYSEVMGEYQTSVVTQYPAQDMPALAYIDIMPRCINPGNIPGGISPTFDSFSTIIYGANSWLMNNRGLFVWKCETIKRKIKKEAYGLSYSLESMFDHQPAFGTDYHVLGLRMWLTKKADPNSPPQQLGIVHVVPDKERIPLPANLVGMGPYGFFQYRGMFIHPMQMAMGLHFTFAGLKETIDKLNHMLEQDPVPGTIVNVETAAIKVSEVFNIGNGSIDPEDTLVRINKEKFTRYTQVIRVYYVQGKPAHEQVGMQTFVPQMTAAPDMMKRAKFSSTTETLRRIATCIHLNIFFTGMGGSSSDSTDNFESCWEDKHMLRTFRVFYTKSKVMPAPMPPPFLTSRIFVPFRTGHRSFETMSQTMDRINAWMKLTGLPIFSVETTRLPFVAHDYQGVTLDRSDHLLSSRSGGYWVNCIRVYFPNVFQEPDPSYFPMALDWRSQNESTSCNIL